MGGVEGGFEQEGIVSLFRVHGDVHVRDTGCFQPAHEFGLFLGIEAEIGVDTEDEPVMAGAAAFSFTI